MDDGEFNNLKVHKKTSLFGDVELNKNIIRLRDRDDPFHGLGYYGLSSRNENVFAETEIDGPVLFGYNGGALGSTADDPPKIALRWDKDGSIIVEDIILTKADCAEDFDIISEEPVQPGTVMVFDTSGALQQSEKPYDKRAAGVISGAGDSRPGITLGKRNSSANRLPLALAGKVHCKVDADYKPVEVGDLLTTSSTLGHAMKADDPLRSFGAVIGKALQPLEAGRDLIPMLVALQ